MVAEHDLQPRFAPQRIVQVHGPAAGDHEGMAHAEAHQRLGDIVGEAHRPRLQLGRVQVRQPEVTSS